MGILRTDTISGLETPTPVTGSVSFDGSGDRLQIENNDNFNFPGDFTIECWVYSITPLEDYSIDYAHIAGKGNGIVASTYSLAFYQSKATFLKSTSGGSYSFITGTSILSNSVWYHFAVTRQSNVLKIFVNGILESSTTVSDNLTNSYSFNIGDRQSGDGSSQYPLNGYISNLRILKGTALYTSNFTPPTRELQPIGDTVLLCCNNPDSAGAEATGKTITVNGDAVASTFSPGLTRDFTYGTQFDGVSRFDTQGYFVPPSGTTEQRSRGRGVFGGGANTAPSLTNILDFVNIQSSGVSQDFGDLSIVIQDIQGCSSLTRGIFAGGYNPGGNTSNVEYITISTQGNAIDFGADLTNDNFQGSMCSSSTRGLYGGGTTPTVLSQIDYITIASTGLVNTFGNLTESRFALTSFSSPIRGIFAGGATPTVVNTIDYVTIASTGNAQNFGDISDQTRRNSMGTSSQTRGLIASGYNPSATNAVHYITISSTGNSQDFGDLNSANYRGSGTSNSIRGLFAGGYIVPSTGTNRIDYVTIASTGNASDFGDLYVARYRLGTSVSDSHGGLS
jgi:hypothetical protein